MEPQDSFRTFKKWYQVAKDDIQRIDRTWVDLEKTIPERIPKKAGEACRRFTDFLARWPVVAFLVFFALVCSRAIWWLTNAQFYIEDGKEFFAPAFNGQVGIMHDYASYFHLVPRVLSVIAASFPVRYGPLVLTLLALCVQAITAAFLMSKRLENQIPSSVLRFWLGFMVIAYPYSNELFGNVAHSQWYLSILTVSLVCSEPGKHILTLIADLVATSLNCLTGPFSPVIAVLGFSKGLKDRHRFAIGNMAALCALMTFSIIHDHSRFGLNKNARFSLFERVISNQVVIGPIRGFHYLYTVPYEPAFNLREFITAVFGVAVVVVGLRKSPNLIKSVALLGLFSFTTCLITQGSWALLGDPGVGERYYFQIGLVLLFCVYTQSKTAGSSIARWLFRGVMAICAVAIVQNWVYDPPFHQFDYAPQIAAYDRLKRGESVEITFPIDRKMVRNFWTMKLVKK